MSSVDMAPLGASWFARLTRSCCKRHTERRRPRRRPRSAALLPGRGIASSFASLSLGRLPGWPDAYFKFARLESTVIDQEQRFVLFARPCPTIVDRHIHLQHHARQKAAARLRCSRSPRLQRYQAPGDRLAERRPAPARPAAATASARSVVPARHGRPRTPTCTPPTPAARTVRISFSWPTSAWHSTTHFYPEFPRGLRCDRRSCERCDDRRSGTHAIVVRHDDDGPPRLHSDAARQFHHGLARVGVEGRGRLVAHQQFRFVDERAWRWQTRCCWPHRQLPTASRIDLVLAMPTFESRIAAASRHPASRAWPAGDQ